MPERNKNCKRCDKPFYDDSFRNSRSYCQPCRKIRKTPKNRCSLCGRRIGNCGKLTDEEAKTLLCSFCIASKRKINAEIKLQRKHNLLKEFGFCGKKTSVNELCYRCSCKEKIEIKIGRLF